MSTSAALSFSPDEIRFIADFLAGAADEFSEQSCDELCVPASQANLQALVPVIAWKIEEYGAEWTGATTPQAYLDSLTTASGELVLPHEWVAAFFSSQYSEALPAEINAAEIMIVGEVLDARAEMHEIWADDDPDTETEPFTLPPTDANKTFMAAVCAYRGRKARSQKIMDATRPISVRIEWVMRYLAYRCKSLAAGGDAVRIAATDAAPAVNSAGMPVLVRLGIAPRFPDVKNTSRVTRLISRIGRRTIFLFSPRMRNRVPVSNIRNMCTKRATCTETGMHCITSNNAP
ncbi:hypothetical protein [Massilia sp. S19_KUP03_FR1]|uniref:hypothetical protein n=1 Tax=Massilia sp. S19_KUP03_FR1 TaxID=3025503 RepID=UPI002FCD9592